MANIPSNDITTFAYLSTKVYKATKPSEQREIATPFDLYFIIVITNIITVLLTYILLLLL